MVKDGHAYDWVRFSDGRYSRGGQEMQWPFEGMIQMNDSVMAICDRAAEIQSLLHDHVECGKHSAAEVVAKVLAIVEDPQLLQAMHNVGYFPEPLTPEEIKIPLWTC